MRIPISMGTLFSLVLSVNAWSIHVRGKVTDVAGKPVANAIVELLNVKLTDTTGADGMYSLGSPSNAARPFAAPSSGRARIDRGTLEFALDEAAPIRIELFDVKGNLLEKWSLDQASAGSYRLNLAGKGLAGNLLIIKATLGNQVKVLPCLPPAGGGRAASGLEYAGPAGGILAKEAAFEDTLKVSASGYQPQTFALASTDSVQDITLQAASCYTPTSPPSAKDAVTFDMALTEGAPTYLASGLLYGISQDGAQPPDALLRDIKVKGFRAGRGVVFGCGAQYWKSNFNVVKAYFSRAKALNASLVLQVSEGYGYCTIPGNGGDWTEFTAFMSQLIDTVKANGMTGPNVRWDLWNEPDYFLFWKGTLVQWLETWKHAYQQIRAAIPAAVIEGPNLAYGPGSGWDESFLDYAKANNVLPDYYTWHEAAGGRDPVANLAIVKRAISIRGINGVKGFDVNEYGSDDEQTPGHSAWYIARFDRAGIQGMRSNWAGGAEFFSNMAGLVAPGWQPNSQYWIYKRYADQTGLRIHATPGSEMDAVGYQDAAARKSIIVIGNRGGVAGSVNVIFRNVPAWLQDGGSAKVVVEKMPAGNGALAAPIVVSSKQVPIACGTMTVTLDWATATDGYVLTLSPN